MPVPTIKFTTLDEEYCEVEHELLAKWAVCPRCEGSGTTVNPAIDGNGLSREDFEEDPDFMIDYLQGAYDIPCGKCLGRTTVLVPDFIRGDKETIMRYYEMLKDEALYRAEVEAERRMGA